MLRLIQIATISLVFLVSFPMHALADTPVCVRVKEATARASKPVRVTASSKKIEIISFDKYTPLTSTGNREGKWIEVQSKSGRMYWLRSQDLSRSMKCLEVTVQKSQTYLGPGPTFAPSKIAERGEVFLDLGGEDGWTRVQNVSGEKVWINLDHTWKPTSKVRMSFTPDK